MQHKYTPTLSRWIDCHIQCASRGYDMQIHGKRSLLYSAILLI